MEIIQKCKDFLETHYKLITIAGLLVIFLFMCIVNSEEYGNVYKCASDETGGAH